jgi:SAM-dependent MidA family methyltransferase
MRTAPTDADSLRVPAPSPEARAHSAKVVAHIRATITASGGWISLADYLNAALYAPGLGYYVAGARKFGSDGDFVTAPELTPLFGEALAAQVGDVLTRTPGDVIELGPGSGRMAADVLAALAALDTLPSRYLLLEVSPDLRARQRELLQRCVPALMPRVAWIDVLPARWRGVVLANEVLDAVAAHVVVRGAGQWYERGVSLERDALILADKPLEDAALLASARALFPETGDYASEINPAAQALVRSLAARCDAGAILLFDYGFAAAEYYHPQRNAGTLMAHYRHHAIADPLCWPGLADLTAHVDFSAMARVATAADMRVAGYCTQARFLINCGILDRLAAIGEPTSPGYLREASAVQKLLSPAEMGELFKVLALSRGFDAPLLGFREGDRSHRLFPPR